MVNLEFEPIVQESRVRRSGAKRQGRTALFVIIGLFAVLAAVYLLFLREEGPPRVSGYRTATVSRQDIAERIQLSGAVDVGTRQAVSAPERGLVAEVYVQEGEAVAAGQVVALITMSDLELQRDDLRAALVSRRRDLERVRLQHEYDRTAAERTRSRLQSAIDDAQGELAETEERHALDAATAEEVEKAADRLDDARLALEDHDIGREEAEALHRLTLSSYDDEIASLEADIRRLEDRIASGVVRSPISGQVISISTTAQVAGSVINQYAEIMEIADTSDPLVQFAIPEAYANRIAVGQEIVVSLGGAVYPAVITRIGLSAVQANDGSGASIPIDAGLLERPASIVPGSSAVADIVLGVSEAVPTLPRGAYLSTGEQRYVYVVSGGRAYRREVVFGTIEDNLVEIRSGLEPGELVITSGYQSFIDAQEIVLEE